MAIVGEAYEVGRHDLIQDARATWTWAGPTDDLIVHVSRLHDWHAEMTVSYLAALQRVRLWNLPDRGW